MHNSYEEAGAWIATLDAQARHCRTAIPGTLSGSMRWRVFGSGTPLVLIHGGHGNWLHWAKNIEALAAAHEVWVPDLPGFGESDQAQPAQDLDALNAAVSSGIDELIGRDRPFGLAAFSFGTRVATVLAATRSVTKLSLLGAAGHGGTRRPYPEMRNWRLAQTDEARRAAFAHNVAAFMLHDVPALGPLAVLAYEASCINTRFRSKNLSYSKPLSEALKGFSCPVQMIWGNEDVTLRDPATIAAALAAGRADTTWQIIPDAGHWVQFERAEPVNDALLQWFSATV